MKQLDIREESIDLLFLDRGYGITYFNQLIECEDGILEICVNDLLPEEKQKADTLVKRTWKWANKNIEQIKDYLASELVRIFDTMRADNKKNVPLDDSVAIRKQLAGINIKLINFYPAQNSFEINFMAEFNGYPYNIYVSVTDDFKLKNGGILTMGGFMAPKDAKKPNFKKADALYEYHLKHPYEKKLYQYYVALPKKEIDIFIDLLIQNKTNENEDDLIDLMLYLALYSYACGEKLPDKLYEHLIDNDIFYYSEIYLRASEKFAESLIDKLIIAEDLEINHILCALAMIPCEQVNNFFLESSYEPLPTWAQQLHILPKEYSKIGGWETMSNGQPHMLYSENITAFSRVKKSNSSTLVPMESLSESCRFCMQPLTLVFDDTEKLATCLNCSCYQTVFTEIKQSSICWHPKNTIGNFLQKHPDFINNGENIVASFEYGMKPSNEKRRASWTANEFTNISHTQIGGMPTAINDMHYPTCPDCGKTMRFSAQFDMADIEYGEGIYYFFICDTCENVGANYNQS